MNLAVELLGVVEALDTAGIEYALCGGLALAVHGAPRATRDIDVLVLPEDVPRIKEVVRNIGFTVAAGPMPFRRGTATEQVVHRVSKLLEHAPLPLALVTVAPWLQPIWDGREAYAWEGRHIAVVSREGLVAMTREAGRAQDLADLERLGVPVGSGSRPPDRPSRSG